MALNLEKIAAQLCALEESIIYKLLDRAQFRVNSNAYTPGLSQFFPKEAMSLFELRLLYQETMDAQFGRYLIPEERPFYSSLPKTKRLLQVSLGDLRIKDLETVNISGKIRIAYHDLLPLLCEPGDDGQYGSSVEHDVICLQALGRRIHYGAIYVAESKFQENPSKYTPLIADSNESELLMALTRREVEERILDRVHEKVKAVQSISDPENRILIAPEVIVDFFKDWIIPLTKEGEIRYLLQRPLG